MAKDQPTLAATRSLDQTTPGDELGCSVAKTIETASKGGDGAGSNPSITSPAVPEKITPRKARHRKIAQGVVAGKTYEQIAAEVHPGVLYPRQTVYNSVQSKGVQREIAAILDYNASELRSMLAQELTTRKRDAVWTRQLELAMKTEAMLVDKQINDTTMHTSTDELITKAEQAIDKLKHTLAHSIEHDIQTDIPISGVMSTSTMADIDK
jgi:hypothetical protein